LDKLPGLAEAFKKAKIVFLTTYHEGVEQSRKMTNLNEDPYAAMDFPTATDTKKVRQIRASSKVLVTFPAEKAGEFYEIEGKAELETGEEAENRWFWWYLYWRPSQRERFWFPKTGSHPERAMIKVTPIKARLIKKG
jgi:general stress protein 26